MHQQTPALLCLALHSTCMVSQCSQLPIAVMCWHIPPQQVAELASHLTHSHIKTAQDRSRPLELHTCLLLPSSTRSVALSAQFTKAFLTAFEHPPDAHRGFDVPAAQITLGGSAAGMACDSVDPAVEGTMPSGAGGCVWAVVPGGGTAGASAAASLPLMRALAEPQPQQVRHWWQCSV